MIELHYIYPCPVLLSMLDSARELVVCLATLADRFSYLHHEPYNRVQILLAVTKTCQLKERELVVSIGV